MFFLNNIPKTYTFIKSNLEYVDDIYKKAEYIANRELNYNNGVRKKIPLKNE